MIKIIVTCEHGGNRAPARYAALFKGKTRLLSGHRGYDIGSLPFAMDLSREIEAEFFYSRITRLLVDLNRSRRHPRFFSDLTKKLGDKEKEHLVSKYYLPFREEVKSYITRSVSGGATILHMAVHSFTPVLNGRRRDADIGLLYDPSRAPEAAFCVSWQKAIKKLAPDIRVRRNYPYLGITDGHVTSLRKIFAEDLYIGTELEINQGFMKSYGRHRHPLIQTLASSLYSAFIDLKAGSTTPRPVF